MKFEWREGLIWLTVELEYEGKRFTIDNCILDTGSVTTAINIDLVDFSFRKPARLSRLVGIGGFQEVITQKTDSIIIDEHELKNVEIEFGNIKENIGINGFIGNNILSLFTVIINYSIQKIEFKSPN